MTTAFKSLSSYFDWREYHTICDLRRWTTLTHNYSSRRRYWYVLFCPHLLAFDMKRFLRSDFQADVYTCLRSLTPICQTDDNAHASSHHTLHGSLSLLPCACIHEHITSPASGYFSRHLHSLNQGPDKIRPENYHHETAQISPSKSSFN